jgi:hypothetical protein
MPQRSPVHIARLMKAVSGWRLEVRESADGQDGVGVIGYTVALGPEFLHVSEGSVTSGVLVVRGKPLLLHLLKPVSLVLGRVPVT